MFFTLFLFITITAITAALFGAWVIVTVLRTIWHVLASVVGGSSKPRTIALNPISARTCTNLRCKASNPADAHFCRRCGQILPQAQRVAVRRAAMW